LIVLVCFLVFLNTYRIWTISGTYLKDKTPQPRKATMFDVRHLLMEGERDKAIRVYCELFNTIPTKAKKDIEELERSLKV
jgi:hypothetical protein